MGSSSLAAVRTKWSDATVIKQDANTDSCVIDCHLIFMLSHRHSSAIPPGFLEALCDTQGQ